MRSLVSLLLAVVIPLLLVGCDGDDGPEPSPLPSGRTAAPTAPGNASEASKLAAKFLAGVDGKYVYLYSGPIGEVSQGTFTLYRLGVNDRQDWTTDQFGFEATTVTILAETENYMCTSGGSFENCRVASVPELEALRVFFLPIYNALTALVTEPDMFEVEEAGEETFAGVTGQCYLVVSDSRIGEGPPASEQIKSCYTAEGAVVYFERTITPESASIEPVTYTLELQETAEVTTADFEPIGRLQ